MKSEKGQAQTLVAILLGIVLFGLCAGLVAWAQSKMPASTTTGGIEMIQPQGANPTKDLVNSQSNLNNSQSNLNNAQATAVLVDAQGNYIYNAARSTAVVADSNQGPLNAYKDGRANGAGEIFGLGTVILVVVGTLAFLGWAATR